MRWYQQISLARERQGLTQTDLARMAGVTQTTVNRAESGEVCTTRVLLAVADVLGIHIVLQAELNEDSTPE